MRCEGYDDDASAAAEGGRSRRRRREFCRSFTCISPWLIFSRWFSSGKPRFSSANFAQRNWGKVEIDRDVDGKSEVGMVSTPSTNDFSEIGKEPSFSFGFGFGLIYLVRNELSKMVELRNRIESLLQEFQTEIENLENKELYMLSRSSICSSLATTHVQGIMHAEEHDSAQSSSPNDVKFSEIGLRCDRLRRESSLRMDQLEAELEAELGLLQLEEDGEFLYPEVNMGQRAAEFRLNACYEEVDNVHEYSSGEFHGVAPRDLERKLHEVLEVRQQERIEELEAALEYAMQQLEEKEREVSLWRDTGRLVAQRLPSISTMLVQVKQSMEPEYEVIERGNEICIELQYPNSARNMKE